MTVAAGVPVAGRVQQRPLLCPVYTRLSPLQLVTGPISHQPSTDMLKHKLRKSRKNILHLLDYAQDQDEEPQIPEYSEIKKPGRKEKSKKKGIWIFKSIFSALSIINNSCLGKQQFARRWDGGGPETAPRQIFRTFENKFMISLALYF